MNSDPSAIRRIESRLDRLEELAGFADRRHDELNAALLDVAARVEQVARRMNDLVGRLEGLAGRVESQQDPGAVSPTDASPENPAG